MRLPSRSHPSRGWSTSTTTPSCYPTHELLTTTAEGLTSFVSGDLRDADVLLRAEATLDLGEPVALMLVSVLHLIDGSSAPYEIVNQLMAGLAPGSYLAVSHGAADIDAENMAELTKRLSERSQENFTWRSREQVTRFFDELQLVDPGVVLVDQWHPDVAPPASDRLVPFYSAIAHKADRQAASW